MSHTIFRPIKSHTHTFGETLMHSRSISRSHAGGLKSHVFVSSCVMFPVPLKFEIVTFSAEESNLKSLPPDVFPELTMPQKCTGGQAVLLRTSLKFLQCSPKFLTLIWEGCFAVEKGKGKEMWKNWGDRKEGEGRKIRRRDGRGGARVKRMWKENFMLYSFVSLRALHFVLWFSLFGVVPLPTIVSWLPITCTN